jgi:sulfur carrier protein
MNVFINHTAHEIEEDSTVSLLIQKLQLPSKGIAISVNETVIPKAQWESHQLNNQDQILIITASQGG